MSTAGGGQDGGLSVPYRGSPPLFPTLGWFGRCSEAATDVAPLSPPPPLPRDPPVPSEPLGAEQRVQVKLSVPPPNGDGCTQQRGTHWEGGLCTLLGGSPTPHLHHGPTVHYKQQQRVGSTRSAAELGPVPPLGRGGWQGRTEPQLGALH